MDSRFCSLTACLNNAKNTKGQSAICEGLEKYKKNTNIQIAFLDVMENTKKTKIQSVFFCILFVFVSYFFCIFTKKIRKKYQKNTKTIRMQLLKNTKYNKMKPTNPNAHTYVNGTDVKTHGYAVTHNTCLQ